MVIKWRESKETINESKDRLWESKGPLNRKKTKGNGTREEIYCMEKGMFVHGSQGQNSRSSHSLIGSLTHNQNLGDRDDFFGKWSSFLTPSHAYALSGRRNGDI